jgi:hypothetical protein
LGLAGGDNRLPFLPGFSEIGIINLGRGLIEEVDGNVLWWVGRKAGKWKFEKEEDRQMQQRIDERMKGLEYFKSYYLPQRRGGAEE